jgi:hypothetical protein
MKLQPWGIDAVGPRQMKVFLGMCLAQKHGRFSIRDLMRLFGWSSTNAAVLHINPLMRLGWVERFEVRRSKRTFGYYRVNPRLVMTKT